MRARHHGGQIAVAEPVRQYKDTQFNDFQGSCDAAVDRVAARALGMSDLKDEILMIGFAVNAP